MPPAYRVVIGIGGGLLWLWYGSLGVWAQVNLNEFMPDPEGDDAAEWIELYNLTDSPVSLENWWLDDKEGGTAPFSLTGKTVNGHGYLVVEKSESGIGLNNSSGDEVRLLWQEHLDLKVDHGRFLWGLLSYTLWHEAYIEKRNFKDHMMIPRKPREGVTTQ